MIANPPSKLVDGGAMVTIAERRCLVLDRELSGVIAHGLVASLDVLSGGLHTLRTFADRLSGKEIDGIHAEFSAQTLVFQSGLQMILKHSSPAFADAATALALAGRALHLVDKEDSALVLQGLVRGAAVLRTGLSAMVLGLSPFLVAGLSRLPPQSESRSGSNFLEQSFGARRPEGRPVSRIPDVLHG